MLFSTLMAGKQRKKLRINWRYTIGEVLIVFIGITIAFSMNTWKEQRSLSAQKNQYIQSLLDDLDKERVHLEQNAGEFRLKIETARNVLDYMRNGTGTPDSALMRFFQLAQLINYNPPRVTYDIMVNTGDLDLINPLSMQKQLALHYANQREVDQDYERLKQINTRYFADLMVEEMDYGAIQRGDFSILRTSKVQNLTQSLLGAYYIALQTTENAAKESDELRKSLNGDREK